MKELAGQIPQGFDQFTNGYATQAIRKQLVGEINYNKPTMSVFDSLLPSVFVPIIEQAADAWGGRRMRISKRKLEEYFHGTRTVFELPLDLPGAAPFSRQDLERLALVPYGEVTTYGALAREARRPQAARAVGTVMNRNPIPIVLPCHRVVGADGSLVGYAGGLDRKELLLKLEGALDSTLL